MRTLLQKIFRRSSRVALPVVSTEGSVPEIASQVDQVSISQHVRQIFFTERADANSKIGNEYWGRGHKNVGYPMMTAVVESAAAILQLNKREVTLKECQEAVEAVRLANCDDPDDEDGFGAATYHGILRGLDELMEMWVPSAPFSAVEALEGFAPKDSYDPVEWISNISKSIKEASPDFGVALDLYAAGDFESVIKTLYGLESLPEGHVRSIAMMLVNCFYRIDVEQGRVEAESYLEGTDFIMKNFLKLATGAETLENYAAIWGGDSQMMAKGHYLVACHHLIRQEFAQAIVELDKCLSLRVPAIESYLAWCDLIAADPTRAQTPN
ncbi:hypothetical protein NKH85_07265 [Mesorhizobium sp. M0924]|uniref:hypothetical protein n=1 Tax=unclassified Mesorhizobium TaxID=325217 RepID=UPI0033389032